MKFKLLLALAIFPFFISCDSDPVSNDDPIVEVVTSVNGDIASWENGRVGKVRFMVKMGVLDTISTSTIDGEGKFSLTDLKDVDSQYLINKAYPNYSDNVTYLDNNLFCSDSIVGYMPSYLFTYTDSDDDFWAQIHLKNFDYSLAWDKDKLSSGDVYVELVYVDGDVSLEGDVEAHYTDRIYKGELIKHYSLKLKRGWNMQVTEILNYEYYFIGDTSVTNAEYNIRNIHVSDDVFWDKS